MSRVAIIHTTHVTVPLMGEAFAAHTPELEVMDILHQGLLREVMRAGGVTPAIIRVLCRHVMCAADLDCHAVLGACSSVSEALEVARRLVAIPVIKIDDAMAEEAVRRGELIAVVATVETTLMPTTRLIKTKALEIGRRVQVDVHLVPGAFAALTHGDGAEHDRLVLAEIRAAAHNSDVVVLAQASMSRLLPSLGSEITVPVLTSPALAVQRVVRVLTQSEMANRRS